QKQLEGGTDHLEAEGGGAGADDLALEHGGGAVHDLFEHGGEDTLDVADAGQVQVLVAGAGLASRQARELPGGEDLDVGLDEDIGLTESPQGGDGEGAEVPGQVGLNLDVAELYIPDAAQEGIVGPVEIVGEGEPSIAGHQDVESAGGGAAVAVLYRDRDPGGAEQVGPRCQVDNPRGARAAHGNVGVGEQGLVVGSCCDDQRTGGGFLVADGERQRDHDRVLVDDLAGRRRYRGLFIDEIHRQQEGTLQGRGAIGNGNGDGGGAVVIGRVVGGHDGDGARAAGAAESNVL